MISILKAMLGCRNTCSSDWAAQLQNHFLYTGIIADVCTAGLAARSSMTAGTPIVHEDVRITMDESKDTDVDVPDVTSKPDVKVSRNSRSSAIIGFTLPSGMGVSDHTPISSIDIIVSVSFPVPRLCVLQLPGPLTSAGGSTKVRSFSCRDISFWYPPRSTLPWKKKKPVRHMFLHQELQCGESHQNETASCLHCHPLSLMCSAGACHLPVSVSRTRPRSTTCHATSRRGRWWR